MEFCATKRGRCAWHFPEWVVRWFQGSSWNERCQFLCLCEGCLCFSAVFMSSGHSPGKFSLTCWLACPFMQTGTVVGSAGIPLRGGKKIVCMCLYMCALMHLHMCTCIFVDTCVWTWTFVVWGSCFGKHKICPQRSMFWLGCLFPIWVKQQMDYF